MKQDRKLAVKVAYDVINQLRAKRYRATPGVYIGVFNDDVSNFFEFQDDNLEESFKTLFKKHKGIKCEVCGIGSLFTSLVNIKNKCSLGDITTGVNWDKLEDIFGCDNLALIESAFEVSYMRSIGTSDDFDTDNLYYAANWGATFDDPEKRLIAIMRNIIRNNGDFVIPRNFLRKQKKLDALEVMEAGYQLWEHVA